MTKIPYLKLETQLTKPLAKFYFIHGDESLLVDEAASMIGAAAKKQGFNERQLVAPLVISDLEKVFYRDTHSISLFSDKKIIDVNLQTMKVNAALGKFLEKTLADLPPETLCVIRSGKLDARTETSAWYKNLVKTGIVIPIWPMLPAQLPAWLIQRSQKLKITLTPAASTQLAFLVEGNLLAAAQEIEKLALLQTDGKIDSALIDSAFTDNAHFDVFQWVDSLLLGEKHRSIRILQNLLAADVEPTFILWAITRELRLLTQIQIAIKAGQGLALVFKKFGVWEKRQNAMRAFLQRHKSEHACLDFLVTTAHIDRMIKGIDAGNAWEALEKLSLVL